MPPAGGFDAISVYEVNPPEPLAVATGDGFLSVGCHADLNGDRIMSEEFDASSEMTGEVR